MIFEQTELAGVSLARPERNADARGYFARTYFAKEFASVGLRAISPQTSLSFNLTRGTVRRMHFQREPHAETKLVRCVRGSIFDVVVDLKPCSPTYLARRGFESSAANGLALYIPEGLAHGFQTLEGDTEVAYAITPAFVPGYGDGVRFDDPDIDVR